MGTKMNRPQKTIIGKYQDFGESSDFHFAQQFAEIGGVDTEVIGDVLVRDHVKDMRTAFQQGAEFFFGGKALYLHHAFEYTGESKIRSEPDQVFEAVVFPHEFVQLLKTGFKIGAGCEGFNKEAGGGLGEKTIGHPAKRGGVGEYDRSFPVLLIIIINPLNAFCNKVKGSFYFARPRENRFPFGSAFLPHRKKRGHGLFAGIVNGENRFLKLFGL